MRFRIFLLPLLLLFGAATSARADLEIEKAKWVGDDKERDVRDVIRAYVRYNILSFRVTADAMGGKLNRKKDDVLEIEYRVNGKKFKDSVKDGRVFTFEGVSGVIPSRPYLGFIPQPVPTTASVRIVNQTPATVLVYGLDRYGRWVWMGDLASGRVFSDTGAVGQQWKVTDRLNQEIKSFTLRDGGTTVTLDAPAGPTRVRFENFNRYVLYVYKLDRWRNWEWVARLDPGATFSVNGISGETWIVIDGAGRTVRQFQVGPNTCHHRFGS